MAKQSNILIVEDEPEMQQIYRDMFAGQQDKYKIEIEGNAEKALNKVKDLDLDLIILDIIMGPMSGDAFLVRLRQDEAFNDLPVLIITVLSPDTLNNLKQYDNVAMMQKPIKQTKLMEQVESMIKD